MRREFRQKMTRGSIAPNQNAFSHCINCDCTGQARCFETFFAVPKRSGLPGAVQKCLNREMELPPELKSPLLPDLSVDELGDDERSSGQSFFDNMLMLQRWSFDFSSSAGLFDWASKPPTTDMKGQWCFIAARNGALALRHYSESLAAARESLGGVTSWQESVEADLLADVQEHFGKRFPGVEKMRTTLCTLSDSDAASHGKVQDCLFGHNYMSTSNGKTVSYDLTFQNAQFLSDLTRRAYDCLRPLYAERA